MKTLIFHIFKQKKVLLYCSNSSTHMSTSRLSRHSFSTTAVLLPAKPLMEWSAVLSASQRATACITHSSPSLGFLLLHNVPCQCSGTPTSTRLNPNEIDWNTGYRQHRKPTYDELYLGYHPPRRSVS